MSNTFELADKTGFNPPVKLSSFATDDKAIDVESLSQLKNLKVKNTLVLVNNKKEASEGSSSLKKPEKDNRQRVYAKKPNKEIQQKAVFKLPDSGITYLDIYPIYNITLSDNLVPLIEKDNKTVDLLEEDLMNWLKISGSSARQEARITIRTLINKYVKNHPSNSKYTPPNGLEKLHEIFTLCIALGVVDLSEMAKNIAQGIFFALANKIRTLKLGEEKWNPNVKDIKYNEETPKDASYNPILFDLSKLKAGVSKAADSLSIEEAIESSLKANENFPSIIDMVNPFQSVIRDLVNKILNLIFESLENLIEKIDHVVKMFNAFLVGLINGIIDLIAGIFDAIGFVISIFNYDTQKQLLDAIDKLWNQFSWSALTKLIKEELKNLFAFLYGDDPYKNAYDFGRLIPQLVELVIDVVYAFKGASGIISKAPDFVKKTNAIIKNLEKGLVLKLDKKTLKALEDRGIEVNIEWTHSNAGQLHSGVPIKVPDGKKIHVDYKGKRIKSFDSEEDANAFLKDLAKDNKKAILLANRLSIKQNSTTLDLIDENKTVIFRGLTDSDSLEKYLNFIDKPINERKNLIEKLRKDLKKNGNRYKIENAQKKDYRDIPMSKNGTSPDFSKLKKYLYNNDLKFGNVKIKTTGSRDKDFQQAFDKMNIDSKTRKQIKKKYTWHHLDDLDENLESTLQLVKKEAHKATIKHLGSAKQFTDILGIDEYLS